MLEMAFYCGLSILYPYSPVYCPREDCLGDCRGVYLYTSKSAPLPPSNKLCEASDINLPRPKNWFQWKPRITEKDRQKYLGERVCYWSDRGEAKNINELERNAQ